MPLYMLLSRLECSRGEGFYPPSALRPTTTTPPMNKQYNENERGAKSGINTYGSKQKRYGGQNGKNKNDRDNLGRALGVVAEDMVDLVELAVAQGFLVDEGLGGRVAHHLHVEDVFDEAGGGAERGDN